MKKNYWPLILFALYTVGFILYFVGNYRDIGVILLIIAVISHMVYTFSPVQRAAISMLNARRFLELGNVEKAKEYVIKAAKLNKNYPHVGYLLSTSKKTFPFYERLAKELEDYAKNESDSTYMKYVTASIYYHIGNLEKTISTLYSVPEENRNTEIARLLGTALLESGKPEEAIEVFKKYEKKEGLPTKEELAILIGLGLCYAEKKDRRKAEKYYLKVKKFNPDFPELNVLRDKIYPHD
jgi:tetratricopeptide (TPR) repeat protein